MPGEIADKAIAGASDLYGYLTGAKPSAITTAGYASVNNVGYTPTYTTNGTSVANYYNAATVSTASQALVKS